MLGPQNFPGSFSLIFNKEDAYRLPMNSLLTGIDRVRTRFAQRDTFKKNQPTNKVLKVRMSRSSGD